MSTMARVDFYVLSEDLPDARLRFACRLAEEAVERGQRVYLQTSSAADTQRLDELLWTFNDRSFLPHEIAGGASAHRLVMVMLGDAPPPASHRDLIVNLTDRCANEAASYERIAEIVDVDPARKAIARERFKQYREQGLQLETHNLGRS
jgi:DNA polymerase III subunit chi